jgi:hypothetical protein
MAGLLDGNYTPDPLSMGLLALGSSLMTPRAMGGGIGPGMNAFAQQAMAAQQMRRQMEQDALQRKLFELKLGEAAESAEERKRKREMDAALQKAARDAYTPASPGSLGGGVTPMSQQGRMLLDQRSGDPEFDAAMLGATNSALNSVGPQQPISAPTAGGFNTGAFLNNLRAAGMPLEAARYEKEMMGDRSPKVVGDALVTPDGRVIYEGGKPQSVAPGGSLVGRDGRVVFQAPDRPAAQPEIIRLMQARDALPPNDPQRAVLDDVIDKARRDRPLVQVDARTQFPKQMASVDAKIAEGDMGKWEAARSARNSIRSLMEASPGAASGPLANAAVTGVDFLASLGVAGEQLTKLSADTAVFNSKVTELVLANIKKLGANPSNADLNEIKKLVPQVTTSKAARDRVAQIMLKYTNRAELDAKHRFNYIQQNQGSAGWNPMKVNEMPADQKALMPGALYQHPITQEIAVYRGNGSFETVVGDD